MKYLVYSLSFIFFACGGGNENTENKPSGTTQKVEISNTSNGHLAAKDAYEVKTIKMQNPACADGEPCTYVNFEYPYFTGEASERANVSVGSFLAINLGLDIQNPNQLLDLEGMVKNYFEIWNENKIISPETRVVNNNISLSGISNGWGVVSIKFFMTTSLGDYEPMNYTQVLNLNEKTGEEVTLINHVSDMASFIMLSENEFRNQMNMANNQPYHAIGFEFEYDVYTLPYNYAFTNKGLEYIYNPDEISLTATESRSFTIPYEELKQLVQLNVDFNEKYYEEQGAL